MHSDNEQEEETINRKDIEHKVERFRDQSQIYLNRLPLLKRQLDQINRLQQFDSYVQKLDEIGKVVRNLMQNIRSIEQLHSQLNEKDGIKLERQIRLLRTEVDREMAEFHTLRDQAMAASMNENSSPSNDTIDNNDNVEPDTTPNELRQRHVPATNTLNDSYDLLEQDLILLRDTINEVAELVKQQQEKISRTEQLTHMAHDRIRDASSILQRAVHNKYVSLASGALLGASLGGPVGFVMGLKIGALVALSGSAVGALSANLMQQRITRNDQTRERRDSYNQAML